MTIERRNETICVLKLGPGTDVTEGILAAHREIGWDDAIILSGMGSVREAHLEYQAADGPAELVIAGPGLEVAAISGQICTDSKVVIAPHLSAVVCDQHGQSFGGVLKAGKNIVCVTLEVITARL